MHKTKIYIENCHECKDCQSKRHYTGDSFETAFDYFCHNDKSNVKEIETYVCWNEKISGVPCWCPKRIK